MLSLGLGPNWEDFLKKVPLLESMEVWAPLGAAQAVYPREERNAVDVGVVEFAHC